MLAYSGENINNFSVDWPEDSLLQGDDRRRTQLVCVLF